MKNIQELKKKYGDGKSLVIRLDNDCSYVYDSLGDEEDGTKIFEGDGYGDCEDLWKTVFPKADVEGV